MTFSIWIWKGVLSIAGCVAAAYVGQELMGGGALGWAMGGAILTVSSAPLFTALLARHARRRQAYLNRKQR